MCVCVCVRLAFILCGCNHVSSRRRLVCGQDYQQGRVTQTNTSGLERGEASRVVRIIANGEWSGAAKRLV